MRFWWKTLTGLALSALGLMAIAATPVLERTKRPGVAAADPAGAARFYADQRLPRGKDVDPAELYSAALDHMRSLPRYSTRRGAYLTPSGQGAVPAKDELGTWENLGPGNVGGTTRALLLHPTKPRIRWAAAASGGIWKSENSGGTWRPLTDPFPNIAFASLAMDPGDPDVIYAGTGEGFFHADVRDNAFRLRGDGIYKTEDGGETWGRLEKTTNNNFRWVNKIVVSASNPRRIYAATRSGVLRSLNGGETWKRVLKTRIQGGCLDVVIRTDRNSDIVVASCGTFEQAILYRNTKAETDGSEWVEVLTEEGMGRTTLAIAPSDQNVIYALSASLVPGPGELFEHGLHAVFRSDSGGNNWHATVRNDDAVKLNRLLLTNPIPANFVACGLGASDVYSSLGWYSNVIAVDPTDPDVVFAGGVDLFRSDDGGNNWGLISNTSSSPPSIHRNQHAIVFHPRYDGDSNQIMFVTGDGGIWASGSARAPSATGDLATCAGGGNEVGWFHQNNDYATVQFYHGAAFPDGTSYIGTAQGHGLLAGNDTDGVDGWVRLLTGNGGRVAIDGNNSDVIYAALQRLSLFKSTDGGTTFFNARSGITDPDTGESGIDNGDFLYTIPYVLDPNLADRLYLGGRRLWRSVNGANSWVPSTWPWASEGRTSALAVSPVDSNYYAIGLDDGTIHYSDVALTIDAATQVPFSKPRDGFVSSLVYDPVTASRVFATYATFGGQHVWSSDDSGATWNPIDGEGPLGLPDVPVHSMVVDPADSDRLFVGTDLGVFVSTTGGGEWAVENTGFANVLTVTLQIVDTTDSETMEGSRYLFAFTHGRGAWRVEMTGEP